MDAGNPGITDMRFAADDGVVEGCLGLTGDFDAKEDDLVLSGVADGVPIAGCVFCLDGGCKDLAFDALGTNMRGVASEVAPIARPAATTSDMLCIGADGVALTLLIKLGLRLVVILVPSPSLPPLLLESNDFLGPLLALLLLDNGGYCVLLVRVVTLLASDGPPIDVVEEMLA